MINHRGPEFAGMLGRVLDRMRPFFGTSSDIVVLSSSGSGGMEAVVVNLISPGDRVLVISIGSFGDRFAEVAAAFGAAVERLDFEWGRAADPEVVRRHLAANPGYAAVLLTHNETSTGVLNPLGDLATVIRATQPEALILVDGISSVGAVPFEMDAWGVDVAVTASQKAWMAAPGLAMVAASPRAWEAMERTTGPRFYFDLRAHRKAHALGETPWTPAVAAFFQVEEGLRLMELETQAGVFARHAACAAAAQAALLELGFRLLADESCRSRTVTAAWVPEGLDWKAFNAAVTRQGVVLAGGQGKLTGKVFRVGHLGSATVEEIIGVAAALEAALIELGRPVVPGSAVAAAQRAALERAAARPTVEVA
jgi:aspartate aminotransferase-like enzyme